MVMLGWLKLLVTIVPPYILAGMAISLALTRSPWPVGIVYGVDLVGAAAGCLIALALMTWLDGVSALFAVGVVGAGASICFRAAWRQSRDPQLPELPVTTWFMSRHPALLALMLAALTGYNASIQPNGITPVLVNSSFEIASAILYESALSFLGLGLVEEPSWGRLLNEARSGGDALVWWIATMPGLAIFLTVFSYNLIGEAVRDALDPKLRKRD